MPHYTLPVTAITSLTILSRLMIRQIFSHPTTETFLPDFVPSDLARIKAMRGWDRRSAAAIGKMRASTISSSWFLFSILALILILLLSASTNAYEGIRALKCPAGEAPIDGCNPSGPLTRERCQHFGGFCIDLPLRRGTVAYACCP